MASRSKQAYCRKCNDPILWTDTLSGKRLALEGSPDPNGNVVRVKRMVKAEGADHFEERMVAIQLDPDEAHNLATKGEKLWIPHAAHCVAQRPRETFTAAEAEALRQRFKEKFGK